MQASLRYDCEFVTLFPEDPSCFELLPACRNNLTEVAADDVQSSLCCRKHSDFVVFVAG